VLYELVSLIHHLQSANTYPSEFDNGGRQFKGPSPELEERATWLGETDLQTSPTSAANSAKRKGSFDDVAGQFKRRCDKVVRDSIEAEHQVDSTEPEQHLEPDTGATTSTPHPSPQDNPIQTLPPHPQLAPPSAENVTAADKPPQARSQNAAPPLQQPPPKQPVPPGPRRAVVDLTDETIVISDEEEFSDEEPNGPDCKTAAAQWDALTRDGFNAGTTSALTAKTADKIKWNVHSIKAASLPAPIVEAEPDRDENLTAGSSEGSDSRGDLM
jgi:hypothetical protein